MQGEVGDALGELVDVSLGARHRRAEAVDEGPAVVVMDAEADDLMRQDLALQVGARLAQDGGDDPELVGKLSQVQKMMKTAERKAKEMTRRKVQLVVARGGNRGKQGRPSGVKGRYKMVDGRMKKEVRAQKRVDIKKRKAGKSRK